MTNAFEFGTFTVDIHVDTFYAMNENSFKFNLEKGALNAVARLADLRTDRTVVISDNYRGLYLATWHDGKEVVDHHYLLTYANNEWIVEEWVERDGKEELAKIHHVALNAPAIEVAKQQFVDALGMHERYMRLNAPKHYR